MNSNSHSENLGAASRFRTLRAYVDAQPRTKTLGAIAEELGIGQSALSRYLGGGRPDTDVALRISREFSISLEGLLDPGSDVEAAS